MSIIIKDNNLIFENINSDEKKYIHRLEQYNKRQKFRKEYISNQNFLGRINYFLYETYVEGTYFIGLISIFLLGILGNAGPENMLGYIFAGIIIFTIIRANKQNKSSMDVGFIKSIGYLIAISLYTIYYNTTGMIIPTFELLKIASIFIFFLPLIGYLFINEEPFNTIK